MVKKTNQKPKTTIASKKLLAERVSANLKKQRINLNKIQTKAVISELLEEIKTALIKGEEVRLIGYFTFKTTMTTPRMAMNLQTGKKMKVPEKRIPKVRFSTDLKQEIAKRK